MSCQLFVEFIAPSTNQMYAGQHWSQRKKHKDQALLAVVACGRVPAVRPPVTITVEPLLGKGKRGYDVSNYSYTFKLIEDALVKRGVIPGDTPAIVREVRFLSPVRADRSGMKITITEAS